LDGGIGLCGLLCIRYWCYAMDIQEKEEITEDIPIVCEFKDVLFEESQGLIP